MTKKQNAIAEANRIANAARDMLNMVQPSKRNSLRPQLAVILDATNNLRAMASPKNPTEPNKKEDK